MASKRDVEVQYFSVGSPALHAIIWRFWSPRKKGDVYVKSRFSTHDHKLSIHQSGVRHERGGGQDIYSPDGPHECRWIVPPREGSGAESVWYIATPTRDLRDAKMDNRFMERVTWLRPGPIGTLLTLTLALTWGDARREGRVGEGACLLRWELVNEQTFLVLGHISKQVPEQTEWFENEREDARRHMPPDWGDAGAFDHRLMVTHEQEPRGWIDLSLDPEEPPGA